MQRWRQADDSPRLSSEVPRLETLRIAVTEWRADNEINGSNFVRIYPVPAAPALFLLPCGDQACHDGGHDITREVMQALRAGLTSFEGKDPCYGSQGTGQCTRVLAYKATATYR